MWRRLLPTLVALGLGFLILALGLLALHGIFVRERDEGRRTLDERHRALEQYATKVLLEKLETRVAQTEVERTRALEDPLVDDSRLLWIQGGRQLLPRTWRDEPRASRAWTLVMRLDTEGPAGVAVDVDKDDPWRERLLSLDTVLRAMARGDRPGLEAAFRSHLSHRARYVLPVVKDVTSTLWLLERFHADGQPDPRLMHSLLRDGLRGTSGAQVPGLQRLLLERRQQFDPDDFRKLADKLIALSERAQVEYVDFEARAGGSAGPRIPLPVRIEEPTLLPGGWYVEPDGLGLLRGAKVEPDELLTSVQAEMRERTLLHPGDVLALPPTGAALAASALSVNLDSPSRHTSLAALDSRYRMKAGLLGLALLLALFVFALAALVQERTLRLVKLRSEFVSTVSHELKTPLSAIRVMAETLERKTAGNAAAGDYPARIVAEADGLTRLVENILTFNRLEKGRWDGRRGKVDAAELLSALVEDAAAQHGVEVRLRVDGALSPEVHGDPELLRILFGNLVHNACRYSQRRPVELLLAARGETGSRVLTVTDNGVGIPRESWERVFEDFRRLQQEGLPTSGGSGLGLAICRRIMGLHGGTIRVSQSSSDGTTFELTFPNA